MPNQINKKTEKVVIIGAGETACIAYEYLSQDSPYEVAAFSVEGAFIKENELCGLPIVPFERLQASFNPKNFKAFVAISYTKLNRVRTRLYREVKHKGYSFVSYVSSNAFVWKNVEIGENCFIFENNVLQHRVRIGNNVILWSGNHIGHRAIVHDNCYVSSHVVVSGYCRIGESCFLGVNSCLGDKITIAKDCIIGAGSVVLKDTEPGKIYVGNPARPLRNRTSFAAFGVRENPDEMD